MSPRLPEFLSNPVRRVLFFPALAVLLGLCGPASAEAVEGRPTPRYASGKPDQAEGGRILDSFRQLGIQGAYWLRFELRVMPRRGAERLIHGHMFGAPGLRGPLTRIVTTDPENKGASHTQVYLLSGGDSPVSWIWNHGQRGVTPRRVGDAELLEPIEDTDLTLFDLQMPFLQWTDFDYEGVVNVRGRPAHAFLLHPPAPLSPGSRAPFVPAAVRVFLDSQFHALTQAEWLDGKGAPLKTVTVLDLKKAGEQWIVKSIDLRNHVSRAKTRFTVTAAALSLELPTTLFAPETIALPEPRVPPERITRF